MTPEEVETFERCISVGGVAIFPADTVYGLATEPDSREGVERLYRLKGRLPDKPSAVMFFQVESALAALPELGERTRAAVECLLPGTPSTVVDLRRYETGGTWAIVREGAVPPAAVGTVLAPPSSGDPRP